MTFHIDLQKGAEWITDGLTDVSACVEKITWKPKTVCIKLDGLPNFLRCGAPLFYLRLARARLLCMSMLYIKALLPFKEKRIMVGNNYYLTRYLRGQPNPALWLATEREDGAVVFFSQIIAPSLAKLVPSRWLDIGLVFWRVYEPRWFHAKKKKKNLVNIQPSWPKSLVNNPICTCILITDGVG